MPPKQPKEQKRGCGILKGTRSPRVIHAKNIADI